jgi:N-hydroxyarylamine O-acetyltransferase
MESTRYLDRLGLDPGILAEPTLDGLGTLQRAHVHTIPFETVAVAGHPHADRGGAGVSLDLPAIYEKLVAAERGGFCYELNGLFAWLLAELGYDVERMAGAVLQDGVPAPPANHLTTVVTLDRRYVVDVGLGVPPMRRPLPLDGTPRTDEAGVTWRAVESDRPDADYLTQYRVGDEAWADRYVFRDVPRELSYVEATCEYLTSAPESPFTGEAVLSRATPAGYVKLDADTLTRLVDGEKSTESVTPDGWDDVVREAFGVDPAVF